MASPFSRFYLVTSEPSEYSARGGEFEIFLFKNCNIDAFLLEVSMIDVFET